MTLYRNVRQVSTGQWLDVLFTAEDGKFSTDADSIKADVARGWGIPERDLTIVEGASDQRTGRLIVGPKPPDSRLEWRKMAATLLNNPSFVTDAAQRGAMAFLIGAKPLTIAAGTLARPEDVDPR